MLQKRGKFMSAQNLTLLTDLYELTMMQGYYEKGQNENVIFDVFFRQNPCNNGYSVCAGLDQVIDYIKNLHFTYDDVDYLRGLGIFKEDFLIVATPCCKEEQQGKHYF